MPRSRVRRPRVYGGLLTGVKRGRQARAMLAQHGLGRWMGLRQNVASSRGIRGRARVRFETGERIANGPQPGPRAGVSRKVDHPARSARSGIRAPAAPPELPTPGAIQGPVQGPVRGPVQGPVRGPVQGPVQGPPGGPVRGPRRALAWVAIALTLHLFLDQVLGGTSGGASRGLWTPDPSNGMVQGWFWTVLDHPLRCAVGSTALLWALRPGTGPSPLDEHPSSPEGQMSARKENAARL